MNDINTNKVYTTTLLEKAQRKASQYLQAPKMDSKVSIQVINLAKDLPLPKYETEGSAGMDLLACIDETIILPVGKSVLVKTGLKVALPHGYELQVRSRSGLAYKKQVFVLNGIGTIDEDYRGEIGVILMNLGQEDFVINRGDRIAQAVISEVPQARWIEVEELDSTERGEGGFGHTGVSK